MENKLKSYMSNVDEVVSLLKQKIERIEKERDEWKVKGGKMAEMLDEARLQIEYLHKRWQQTGSGNNVLSRIETALNAWNGNPKKEGNHE
jgi:site-specific recombinase